ncbi:hypothetical protein [Pseudoprimorskyibacter insulae]|uniref:Uncharacterized protein n=1 Tax=Pseudoprimorskyibacter insulae TaxID=1695997 RepID=A0A2R8AQD0_9RHOB|nr:hypothetical protein [Pseudoprimorskyibacter insulae]SPF78308.1 hypothetical protein PRI8871_00904 [Pseudoprimorskyibacter insulae]
MSIVMTAGALHRTSRAATSHPGIARWSHRVVADAIRYSVSLSQRRPGFSIDHSRKTLASRATINIINGRTGG